MKLTINKDVVPTTITIEQNGVSITLTPNEVASIQNKVNTELYYRQDVINVIVEKSSAYDHEAILRDEELLNDMVEHYAELRIENNGGDPDEMMDWTECMDETMDFFEDELSQYLLEKSK